VKSQQSVYIQLLNINCFACNKKSQINISNIPSNQKTIYCKCPNCDAELKIGDIITFYSNTIDTGGYTVTHRIVDIYKNNGVIYYTTKGDNNMDKDAGLITIDNVVGKCKFIIPSIGKMQIFITSRAGWILIILIPALGIILMDIKKLIKIFRIKEQIDEIPQILNILKGDMSFVGPRPPLPREVMMYTKRQYQRLAVTPGLTCYWQIQPQRNSLSFDEWLSWDLKYISERSLKTDIKILFKTVGAVCKLEGE